MDGHGASWFPFLPAERRPSPTLSHPVHGAYLRPSPCRNSSRDTSWHSYHHLVPILILLRSLSLLLHTLINTIIKHKLVCPPWTKTPDSRPTTCNQPTAKSARNSHQKLLVYCLLKMDAWRPKHVEDYDAIKCLWLWKCIKLVTLLWYIMIHGQQNIKLILILTNRGMAFGFRKTATALIEPDRQTDIN
jgi:hypothetical protein